MSFNTEASSQSVFLPVFHLQSDGRTINCSLYKAITTFLHCAQLSKFTSPACYKPALLASSNDKQGCSLLSAHFQAFRYSWHTHKGRQTSCGFIPAVAFDLPIARSPNACAPITHCPTFLTSDESSPPCF